jgi:predicted small metal-binding protein
MNHGIHMFVLVCRETGLDCDYIIKGETKKEFLENGAEHAIDKHGMNADDIYSDKIPVNFLCHSLSKINK